MKTTSNKKIPPIILIVNSADRAMNEGSVSPHARLFDLGSIERILQVRLLNSSGKPVGLTISEIEAALSSTEPVPHFQNELISEIVFCKKTPYLEKVFLLTKLYRSSDMTNPEAKKKIIRNICYFLFAKEQWFNDYPELAEQLFNQARFDDLFFKKRIESTRSYRKNHNV